MTIENMREAVRFIQAKTSVQPEVGIILGTGLSGLANEIEIIDIIEYEDIPYFPVSTVESHKGRLILGKLGNKPVVAMQGRFHYYEGYNMQQITFPVRVMKLLGISHLFVSNAAGGLNTTFDLANLMIITDHISLLPTNPLTGSNLAELGIRFPDMLDAYHPDLIAKAEAIAQEHNIEGVQKGVYVSVPGPNLETPAEYKYLSIIGADAVGMSTIPEVIVARHMDLPVFAVSVITDLCYEGKLKKATLEDILVVAGKAEPKLTKLMKQMVERL
ncbi:purine-nucleoside phosphorylase [Microscilla marina]|uniref:Purine nucleoside phosphorylase n=1 Tax=Microscilla marina ATCC 23134 TaxID=313606 RepID=A1ZK33_MICM2|nr:purine-nucleoside phosphorylase [Microscilla marina]EAY29059.1 purine nucleoside phosphorylase I, inosine and guanosine-specific [Microscilla marina ATCC 23134]